jgi:hypothetical protein
MSKHPCSFPDCGRPYLANGLCVGHYQQHRRGQPLSPLFATRRRNGEPPRIEYDEQPCPRDDLKGPCHIFRGGKDNHGYGKTSAAGKDLKVHKYVWEKVHGAVPKGLELDHQCRVRACCNVDHLRAVTHQVNLTENVVGMYWQLMAAKTHCPQGHPYDETNTMWQKGHRLCRECHRRHGRETARRKASLLRKERAAH